MGSFGKTGILLLAVSFLLLEIRFQNSVPGLYSDVKVRFLRY